MSLDSVLWTEDRGHLFPTRTTQGTTQSWYDTECEDGECPLVFPYHIVLGKLQSDFFSALKSLHYGTHVLRLKVHYHFLTKWWSYVSRESFVLNHNTCKGLILDICPNFLNITGSDRKKENWLSLTIYIGDQLGQPWKTVALVCNLTDSFLGILYARFSGYIYIRGLKYWAHGSYGACQYLSCYLSKCFQKVGRFCPVKLPVGH